MKRPWNRIDLPVYSVSSKNNDAENMHICTYVSSVSMSPKRMMVALYHNTKTLDIVTKSPHFVLQLLSESQYNLIKLLGQTSGNTIDKMSRLKKRKILSTWKNFTVLKDALAYIELKSINTIDGGDHTLHICDVISFYNNLPGEPLTLNILRDKKLIRG
jgi:flavin reductase (DIM6/NTAB) family NADH-FMN oxidoreductase RutF